MKIFFSYGHDDKASFVQKVKKDLIERGFNVWIDSSELKIKDDWEIKLEEGIIDADEIIYFITPHSARRPDGYCLNELAFAVANGKKITPIMLDYVTPPLSICRIQYLDIQHLTENNSTDGYNVFLDNLIKILKAEKELSYEGNHTHGLSNILNPIDFSLDFKKHLKNFVGREWLFDKINELLINSDQQLLWITAEAGFGKSAFSAYLAHNHENIVGVHFCAHDNSLRKNPKNILKSLMFQLSTQIKEYERKLTNIKDLKNQTDQYSASEILDEFILAPLQDIKSDRNIFFVIDALDESESDGKNELAEIIPKFKQLPQYIKIIVTSRPEPYLKVLLSQLKMIELKGNNNDNIKDLEKYLQSYQTKIIGLDETVINSLIQKSEGNILYLKEIIEGLQKNEITLDDLDSLPKGMYGLYYKMFDRYFSDLDDYKKIQRPLFELMAASYEPLSFELIMDILDWDDYALEDALEPIGSLVDINNNALNFFHKSLIDWLINREASGRAFYVSSKKGHERITDYFLKTYNIEEDNLDGYPTKYLPNHLLVLKLYEELCSILKNDHVMTNRIKLLSLDTTVKDLFLFLAPLLDYSKNKIIEFYSSKAFLTIFAHYRRYFYNSGIYLDLKNMSFDTFLEETSLEFHKNTLISIIFYYYITEDFERTIEEINLVLKLLYEESEEYAEIINILGLSYRKLVNFTSAKKYFYEAKHLSQKADNVFEESIASVNIAKINYHNLEFDEAIKINLEGIELLQESIKRLDDSNKIKSERLFLAEYYRLHAELLLWHNDLDDAKNYLEKGKEIYSELNIYDRYYVRWEYTSIFYNILVQNYKYVEDNYTKTLKLSKNKYDSAQINFLYALNLFLIDLKNGTRENVGRSLKVLEISIENNRSIKAYLELEENLILKSYIEYYKNENQLSSINYKNSNVDIEKWINYMKKMILDQGEEQ